MDKRQKAYELAVECENCRTKMIPEFFLEEETATAYGGYPVKTGRKRWNVNYFICPSCLKKACCDDSFATEWTESFR